MTENKDINIERAMRRIKKCLALSRSDNEHEAALALRQAQTLMNEYGVTLAEASAPEVSVLDLSEGRLSRGGLSVPEMWLYGKVAHFFGCSLFSRGNWPIFVGVAPGPKIAEYAAANLLRQLRASRKTRLEEIRQEVGAKLSRSAVSDFNYQYSVAWIYRVEQKIATFAQGVSQEEDRIHRAALGGDIKDSTQRNRNSDALVQALAYCAAYEDSENVVLNHGVDGAPIQQAIAQESSTFCVEVDT